MGLQEVQKTAKITRGLENMTFEDRLNDRPLFKVEKRSLSHDNNYQVCRALLKQEGNKLSSTPNGLRQRITGLNCTKGIPPLGRL